MLPQKILKFNSTSRLTSRELEVLTLLSEEHSTKEIALKLNLSNSTIESHRRNLLIKMQVRNVAGLIRRAFELGILRVHVDDTVNSGINNSSFVSK